MENKSYGLDPHCLGIINEYREMRPVYERLQEKVMEILSKETKELGVEVNCLESRIKTEESLAGKLAVKGYKYSSLSDITDILGARIVLFYAEDMDKIASMLSSCMAIDWSRSVDKRKVRNFDSFGYVSIHYICRIPESYYSDPGCPELNQIEFEVQVKTALMHVWATIEHDIGYKSAIEIPQKYRRQFSRLAGMLEIADGLFSQIRMDTTEYRRKVGQLVKDGEFDEVDLTQDSFEKYIAIHPFQELVDRISGINQAEVYEDSMLPFFIPLVKLGFKTLGDIEAMRMECSDDAYRLAVHTLGKTDYDIITASIALKNLCIAWILKHGGTEAELTDFFSRLRRGGKSSEALAEKAMRQARSINLI